MANPFLRVVHADQISWQPHHPKDLVEGINRGCRIYIYISIYVPRIPALILQKFVLLLFLGEMIVGTIAGISVCVCV